MLLELQGYSRKLAVLLADLLGLKSSTGGRLDTAADVHAAVLCLLRPDPAQAAATGAAGRSSAYFAVATLLLMLSSGHVAPGGCGCACLPSMRCIPPPRCCSRLRSKAHQHAGPVATRSSQRVRTPFLLLFTLHNPGMVNTHRMCVCCCRQCPEQHSGQHGPGRAPAHDSGLQ